MRQDAFFLVYHFILLNKNASWKLRLQAIFYLNHAAKDKD
jgi:hypothetical protein